MHNELAHLGPRRPAPSVEAPLRVGIAPTPDFTLMSLTGLVEFLRLSADERDYSRQIYCSWDLLSHNEQPIYSSCKFGMLPTRQFGDPQDYDYIVVHGGILHGANAVPQELMDFVMLAVSAGVPVIGLCTGQFVLAHLGLLDGRRCAVHFSMVEAMRQLHPRVIPVTDQPVVIDGGFITCAGGLASINLAMHLVTEHCGQVRSDKTLHYLMADRGFEQMQVLKQDSDEMLELRSTDHRVVNAVGLMRQRMYETGTVGDIARSVGVSERELTRLFNQHLRVPPAEYWRLIRLKTAHWMVLNSNRSITQIAYECGFTDSSHLIHWFKRAYQVTPSRLRSLRKQVGAH
ncbi:GlxA family transcriptional regulator [Pseudomonas koreensis]|uniref:Helix-turn-helix domain-containing protein n=1 Tax=Pseudomonas koreensis TaxID=198620 RepID=A0A9X3B2A3_9PSED|nr:helix-turn-helix domain-containing protein [Pseudomonas koreensis]MCU7247966.1 helix-turn-helix domain-containing protein [Pseudomonas koreensis]